MKFEDIVYLDTSFVVSSYEQFKGEKTPTKITRSEDSRSSVTGGIFGIRGSLGASSKETKEFPISTLDMYREIEKHLNTIETTNLKDQKEKDYPSIFWSHGFLGLGFTRYQRKAGKSDEDFRFQLVSDDTNQARHLDLITNPVYLTSGYDQVLNYGKTITGSLWLKIKILVRILYHNPYTDDVSTVGTPLIILKEEEV